MASEVLEVRPSRPARAGEAARDATQASAAVEREVGAQGDPAALRERPARPGRAPTADATLVRLACHARRALLFPARSARHSMAARIRRTSTSRTSVRSEG